MMSGLCQNPINTLRAMKEIYYPSLKATVNLCGRLPEFSKETREQSQESLNATPRPCTPATICPTKRMIGPVTGRAKAELISASRMTVSAGMSVNILSTDGLRNLSPDDSNSFTLSYRSVMKRSTNGSMQMPDILSRYWFGLTATASGAAIPDVIRKPTFPRGSRSGNGLPRSCNAGRSGIGKRIRRSPDKVLPRFRSALKERHALPSSANYPEKELAR